MLDDRFELSRRGRLVVWGLVFLDALFIGLVCFLPQPQLTNFSTPGIITLGRLIFLLRPFNSLWALPELTSWGQLVWVLVQNLLNILLLFPLVFGLIWLYPSLRASKKVVLLSLCLSLTIESTQLLLDWLINANRVFEIDDLLTNTLGGYLAWRGYGLMTKPSMPKNDKN